VRRRLRLKQNSEQSSKQRRNETTLGRAAEGIDPLSVETRLQTLSLTSVFPLPLGNSHFEQI
jgi:hypothetical protein